MESFLTVIISLQTHKEHLKKLVKSVYSKAPIFMSNYISEIVMFTVRNLRKNKRQNKTKHLIFLDYFNFKNRKIS